MPPTTLAIGLTYTCYASENADHLASRDLRATPCGMGPADLDAGPAPLTSRTTYAELTPAQRAGFGGYVQAKEAYRAERVAAQRAQERARDAMRLCGDDKGKALALLLGQG